jgi:serine/threonine-protein kinase RsbW
MSIIDETRAEAGAARLSLEPGLLVRPVLARVISMLAARAALPIDRLNDAVLIGDAVAAHAARFAADGRVHAEVTGSADGLALSVGPLVADGAAGLRQAVEVPEAGSVFERLADDVETGSRDGGGEFVVLRLRSR